MAKTRLTKMIFDEVSLVAAGDNPPALVVLMKSDDSNDEFCICDTYTGTEDGKCERCGKPDGPPVEKSGLSSDFRYATNLSPEFRFRHLTKATNSQKQAQRLVDAVARGKARTAGTQHRAGFTWVKPTAHKKGYWRKLPTGNKGRPGSLRNELMSHKPRAKEAPKVGVRLGRQKTRMTQADIALHQGALDAWHKAESARRKKKR